MISASAIASIEWLFEKSLGSNSVLGPEDRCAVAFQQALPDHGEEHCLIALNISSYAFRIVALFDFSMDAATKAHFARIMKRGDETLEGQALLDAFGEFTNMICGEVNRGLSTRFRHVGLSTPFVLENTCLSHASMLNPTHLRAIEVAVNDAVHFKIVLCVCVGSESPLDFDIERTEHQEIETGELEFF
jgi:hypothetical protein